MAVTMLLSRSASVLWQNPQHRLLLSKTFYTLEYKNYKENRHKYEYRQTRNFKDFGHTRKKFRLIPALPIVIPSIGLILSGFVDWNQ